MISKAFKMTVLPNYAQEYTRRHNPIWPELKEVLKSHGVVNYNIFLDKKTNTLFAYAEILSEEKWNSIAETEICKKWWSYMAEIMETEADNSPKTYELKEVFNLLNSTKHSNF
jgi:L-rhamnose mutarotase